MATKGRPSAETFTMELRRGAIVLSVLSTLQEEQYGYSLKQVLAEQGLAVPEGTLYPLLRRLEAQGLLSSRWKVGEKRPRRYYKVSRAGRTVLRELAAEWKDLVAAVGRLVVRAERVDRTA